MRYAGPITIGAARPGVGIEREALVSPFDSPRAWVDAIQTYIDAEGDGYIRLVDTERLARLRELLEQHIVFTRYDGVELRFVVGQIASGNRGLTGFSDAPRWSRVGPIGSKGFDLDEIEWFEAPAGVTVVCRVILDRPDEPFLPHFTGTGKPYRISPERA